MPAEGAVPVNRPPAIGTINANLLSLLIRMKWQALHRDRVFLWKDYERVDPAAKQGRKEKIREIGMIYIGAFPIYTTRINGDCFPGNQSDI